DQSPRRPWPLDAATVTLSENVPLYANYNPSDAENNPQRITAMAGFTMPKSYGIWSGTLSYAHTEQDIIRGFVVDATGPSFDVTGERSSTKLDEVYLHRPIHPTAPKNTHT